ncbi:MAG: DinB family protein [Phycisphaerales bacterium JB039]
MSSARAAVLASAIDTSVPLLTRFLDGFDESNRTRQAPGLPNHACWSLGHCALTMLRVREKLSGQGLPESDFVAGPRGDGSCFGTESVAFGSRPADDPAAYPSLARSRAIFEQAASALAAAIRSATDEQLDRPIPWGRAEITLAEMLPRMVFHNGTHAGQLVDLRRALGMPPVIR